MTGRKPSKNWRNKAFVKEYNRKYGKKYYKINRAKLLARANLAYQTNRLAKIKASKDYYLKNKKKCQVRYKSWALKNKRKLRDYWNAYKKKRRATDISYKLRYRLSNAVFKSLRGMKRNISCMKFFPFSIQELKVHLESQFEPWMSWNNWGPYNSKTWDDNDKSTWTWQIDHIIPHSSFKYKSMSDIEFTKAWALNNLRPYSAKDNVVDGSRKSKKWSE